MKSFKSWISLNAILMIGFFFLLPVDTAHAQEGFQAAITVDSATVNAQTGKVTVSGTVTCSQPAFTSDVTVIARQTIGRTTTIRAQVSTSVVCDQNGETYTVSVFADQGIFKPGPALIQASIFACDAGINCDSEEIFQPVRLEPAHK
jgi:lipopolysaccharide export system protein LptA